MGIDYRTLCTLKHIFAPPMQRVSPQARARHLRPPAQHPPAHHEGRKGAPRAILHDADKNVSCFFFYEFNFFARLAISHINMRNWRVSLMVPNNPPPWLTAQKAGEITLLEFWRNNGSFQERYMREFIKDALFLEISGICSSVLTVPNTRRRRQQPVSQTKKKKCISGNGSEEPAGGAVPVLSGRPRYHRRGFFLF